MATTKKTTKASKPAAKKTAAPAKPRSDYKPGARVKVTRKVEHPNGGHEWPGFVTSTKDTPTGKFISVNIGSKQTPDIIEARPAAVRGY